MKIYRLSHKRTEKYVDRETKLLSHVIDCHIGIILGILTFISIGTLIILELVGPAIIVFNVFVCMTTMIFSLEMAEIGYKKWRKDYALIRNVLNKGGEEYSYSLTTQTIVKIIAWSLMLGMIIGQFAFNLPAVAICGLIINLYIIHIIQAVICNLIDTENRIEIAYRIKDIHNWRGEFE